MPNEFKLFVPQTQKTKKLASVAPNFHKSVKENNVPEVGGESAFQNKSEIPEESLIPDAKEEDENQQKEHHVEEEMINESGVEA